MFTFRGAFLLLNCSKFFKSLTQLGRFLQFVTATPRLSSGGFTSLYPKLKVVRKVKMKEKLWYAITKRQSSFHFS
ncbi:HECT-domain (ubiquitin-transferase) protein [Medicago truncatula]|uniref:HECT-domain (Ubiquitin-transferase) protein n=1 Tax=Medicago truncatula TaxID=3880 RepID=G7L4Y3_MEDTR|nr:HECT-domain (ubiquitin-transferase) protein [Medicago truncatula]